jgi:hypothetical protein
VSEGNILDGGFQIVNPSLLAFSAGSQPALIDVPVVPCVLPAGNVVVGQQPEVADLFAFCNFATGEDLAFTNDFASYSMPQEWRPTRKSVLVELDQADALLLAFQGTKRDAPPGSVAAMDWVPNQPFYTNRSYTVPVSEVPCTDDRPVPEATLNNMQSTQVDWTSIEVPHRMVLRTRLDDIQRMCGQRFTLDASCDEQGVHKQFARSCAADNNPNSLGKFISLTSLEDEHVWLNLLSGDVDTHMQHYFHLKRKSPTTVSGCFLVPYRPDCEWFKHFSHMQVLKEYSAGTSLFFTKDGKKRTYLPGIPGPMRVYYDPQDPAISTNQTKSKFLLNGRVFSGPAKIFIDGGANTQYVGLETCKRMGGVIVQLKDQPKAVQVGDGRHATVVGACRIPVSIGAYRGFVTALVLDQFSKDFDLVLGESWLKAYKAQLNYGAYGAMRLRVANRSIVIRVGQRGRKTAALNSLITDDYRQAVRSGTTPADLITTPAQLKKSLKRNNGKYFMINVRYREHNSEAPTSQLNAFKATSTPDGRTEVQVTPEAVPFDHPLDTAGVYSAEPSSIKVLGGEVVVDKAKLETLLGEYQDVFPEGLPPGMPPERNVVHPIPIEPGAKPAYKPMYRLSPEEKEECEKQVKELLEKGLIQPSNSPWGAPILFVPKPNGKLRMCCDFRMLNRVTIKNKFPMPRIDDLLDVLHGKRVFSSLDLQSGYWQIALRPEDMRKSAFNTHFGHFEFKVMTFGLSNAPATFQSLMNDIFLDCRDFVVVYLDDILIFSDSPEQHMQHLKLVLDKLRQHKLYAQMPKCDFGLSELKFLGHIVGEFGVKPDPDKVRVVQDWPEPANAAELRSFLGLAQYFRKFIQGYAQTVCNLYDLLKTNAVYNFTSQHRKAFEQVKYSLTNAPVLKAPDFSKPFELYTDASTHGIGSVLLQDGHPIAYESRKLSSAEFNYTTTEQELLAVVHSLKVFRPYIQNRHMVTTIYTDHRALEWLLTKQDVSRREARWLEEISRYHLKLSYIPGRTNVADPVSRVPALMFVNAGWLNAITRSMTRAEEILQASAQSVPVNEEGVDIPSSPEPIQADEADDDVEPTVSELLSNIVKWYKDDAWFSVPSNLSRNSVTQDHTGLFYRDGPAGKQLVIPNYSPLREAIMREQHNPPWVGHRGRNTTIHLIQRLYWWPNMQDDIRVFLDRCHHCKANKSSGRKPTGIAKSMPTPEYPWQRFSMDWMTDFPVTKNGFDSILVVVDYLTKCAHFIPTNKKQTSEDVAKLLRREVVRLHGVAEVVVSDRDPKLVANFMKDLFKCLGMKHHPSTSFHPQTDGQTERINRVIQEMLRNYVSPIHDDWDEYLDLAEFAYNNSYHESIKTTPFWLTYGYDPRSPSDSITIQIGDEKIVDKQITPANRLCSMRCVTNVSHNVPVCMGPAKYYEAEEMAHLLYISDSEKKVPECPTARKFTSYMQEQLRHARQCLDDAKQRQRAYAQKRMLPVEYIVGDYVWLSTVNLRRRLKGTPKLMPKFCGPFKILKAVNNTAYELDIGDTKKKVHPVFHSSLFKKHKGPVPKRPMPILLDEDKDNNGAYERYEVEMIVNHRYTHRRRSKADGTNTAKRVDGIEYLVKWKGFDVLHNTWESSTNVDKCKVLLREYWQRWRLANPGQTPEYPVDAVVA